MQQETDDGAGGWLMGLSSWLMATHGSSACASFSALSEVLREMSGSGSGSGSVMKHQQEQGRRDVDESLAEELENKGVFLAAAFTHLLENSETIELHEGQKTSASDEHSTAGRKTKMNEEQIEKVFLDQRFNDILKPVLLAATEQLRFFFKKDMFAFLRV